MGIRPPKWILLGLFLALLALGYSLGSSETPPPGQPAQISSRVHYDPKMTDPFFQSNDWSHPRWIHEHPKGCFRDSSAGGSIVKDPPRLQHTAKCYSDAVMDKHLVKFCKARLAGENMIDLLMEEDSSSFFERLRIQIRNGMFTSQFWSDCTICPSEGFVWRTTRQALILDRKVYRKGDVIKGRIDFECVEEYTDPKYLMEYGNKPISIHVKGVFKTIVE